MFSLASDVCVMADLGLLQSRQTGVRTLCVSVTGLNQLEAGEEQSGKGCLPPDLPSSSSSCVVALPGPLSLPLLAVFAGSPSEVSETRLVSLKLLPPAGAACV